MADRLAGTRALVTSADTYMGPAIVELFEQEGAHVTADTTDLTPPAAAAEAVGSAGDIDVLVANLATPPRPSPATDIADDDWSALFDQLVHPLMRLIRAVLPPMIERGSGKIVAITSAAPLRGIPGASAYTAARGAQNAFVRSVGLEVARHGVQVNAVAQNYVKNNVYYSEEMLADTDLVARMERAVPAGRLAESWESAELALFLASDRSDFIVGQVIPFSGGWTTTM
ncbi:MAG: SDR family NAD(P)-dependent oxidoreductase [Acidimicrobiales bacterium]